MKQPITFAICGFGNRGRDAYAAYQKQHSNQMKIVAVAEPVPERLMAARTEYGVEEAMCFENAETLLKQPKLADVMIIATQDRQISATRCRRWNWAITCCWKNRSPRNLRSA